MQWKRVWELLTGNPSEFELDNRIFNSVSVFTLSVLIGFLISNIILGIKELAALSSCLLIIQSVFYFLSRFYKIYKKSFVIYGFISYLALLVAFFLNSGTYGPTLFIFFLTFHLLIAFTPRKSHKMWVLLHFIFASAMLAGEYLYPDAIPNTYRSRSERYIDLSISYLITLAFIYFATIYLRNMLSKEKMLAEKRSEEIEGYNMQILQQNQNLEKLNQEKDKLFSIVSHDLRSPLNTIQSYLEILTGGDIDDEEKQMIESELLALTKNTSDMLANMLSWSKSQMEGVSVRLTPVSLPDTLSTTLDVQKLIAHKKGVTLSYDMTAGGNVIADKDMLQLVIRNLVNNAVKFTPSGGEVSVNTTVTGNDCRLVIKDNGIGITAEQQKELFTLKSKSTYGTMNEKGVGLGLLLCKEFIELQEGHIWFISSPGIGTTFYISLPVVGALGQ
jgi:two-component system, sensor histidine kinase and response regulator